MRITRKFAFVGFLAAALAGPGYAIASRPLPDTAAKTVSATYSCTISGNTFSSPVSITGTTPATTTPNTAVRMTGFYAKVTIPSAVIQGFEQHGFTWLSGSGFTFDIKASDAKTATVNAGGGLAFPKKNLPTPAANLTVSLSASPKTVGPWTSAKAGRMAFTDGSLEYTLNDNLGFALPVTCTPKPAITISTTTVS